MIGLGMFGKTNAQESPYEPLKTKKEVVESLRESLHVIDKDPQSFYRLSDQAIPPHPQTKHKRVICYDMKDDSVCVMTSAGSSKDSLTYEFGILARFRNHENLVTFKETFLFKGMYYTIVEVPANHAMELSGFIRRVHKSVAANGSSSNAVTQDGAKKRSTLKKKSLAETDSDNTCSRPVDWTEELIGYVLKEILKGLVHLHIHNVVHRDLQPKNIQIDVKGGVKICDTLFAYMLTKEKPTLKEGKSNLYYMAPEIARKWDYDQTVDVWSFGILTLKVAENRVPHEKIKDSKEVAKRIVKRTPPRLTETAGWSADFKAMHSSCLEHNVHARTNSIKLLKHKFWEKAADQETFKTFANAYIV